ncbi:MAG: DUF3488 domain-containing protein, partial [Gemmatimonadetes bacterium]|nr:DUF3488 domain-containing protein [Gemmatimonadota bacterium]
MTLVEAQQRALGLTALAVVAAYGSATGLASPALAPAALLLVVGLFWRVPPEWSGHLERIGVTVAVLLVSRAAYHALFQNDDVVYAMADLLLALLGIEGIRAGGSRTSGRVYGLCLALILAASAYRPGVAFAAAFLAFIAMGTLSLFIGNLRREADERALRDVPIPPRFLGRVVLLSGCSVLGGVLLFLCFPRVSGGWIPRRSPAADVIGFSDDVALTAFGSRLSENPEVVLRVEFPDGRPADLQDLHWKGRSFDHFDGERWTRTVGIPPALGPTRGYQRRWGGPMLRQLVYAKPLDVPVLFALHPLVDVTPRSRIRIGLDDSGDLVYAGGAPPVYVATSLARTPTPDALRRAPDEPSPADSFYLQLPRLSPRVGRLADSLTAGAATRYDRVVAVQDWFRREFRYTLDLPARADQTSVEYFLFERRAGHCAYFSTAMVVLLRSIGIPARNVDGFLGGEWNELGHYLVVTQNHAHSWVEVWFPGFGWVPFDPTPAAAAAVGGPAAATWLAPLRLAVDALEHRWGKWVLDYDLGTQLGLLQRTARLFSRPPARGPSARRWLPSRPALLLGLVAAAAAAAATARRRAPTAPLSAEARIYRGLRRAYARAGFQAPDSVPPLAFAEALERAGAPGAADARELVSTYVRARFGGEDIGEAGRSRMRAQLAALRRALRAAEQPHPAPPP